jgi:hypothetical protein
LFCFVFLFDFFGFVCLFGYFGGEGFLFSFFFLSLLFLFILYMYAIFVLERGQLVRRTRQSVHCIRI